MPQLPRVPRHLLPEIKPKRPMHQQKVNLDEMIEIPRENLDKTVRELPELTDLDETEIDLEEMEIDLPELMEKDLPELTDPLENPENLVNPENLDNPEMMLLSIELIREETERRENMVNTFDLKLDKKVLPEREFTIENPELEEERKSSEVALVLETGVLTMVMENGIKNPSLKTLPRLKVKPLKKPLLPPFLKKPKNKRRPERKRRRESRKKKRRRPS